VKYLDIDLQSPSYTPERLFDEFAYVARAANRTQIAQALEVHRAMMTRILGRRDALTEGLMVRIMDRTGWSIAYVRELAGIPFDGDVYPARSRIISTKQRDYQLAKADILLAMPGTVDEIMQKSGWSLRTVREWIGVLRKGSPSTRASHISGFMPQGSRPGPPLAIHSAGPGEDAVRIVPRIRGVKAKKSRFDIVSATALKPRKRGGVNP
jgi:hypothetical protein